MKRTFLMAFAVLGLAQVPVHAWTFGGHERLAEKILSHPLISSMLSTSKLDRETIVEFCRNGDTRGAHDFYRDGGWGGIKTWSSFTDAYLLDARIGTVRKSEPSQYKYLEITYNFSDYSKLVCTSGSGSTQTITVGGSTLTGRTPTQPQTCNQELYWFSAEEMFGLFLHNLTDCSVPAGHTPARQILDNTLTETSFEAEAANDPIPAFSEASPYVFPPQEIRTFFPTGVDQVTEEQFAAFWAAYCGRFEQEVLACAARLKAHVEGSSSLSQSEWLSGDCFKACLKLSVLATYMYLENTKAYTTESNQQPSYNFSGLYPNGLVKEMDLTPFLQLLLVD